MIDLRSDTVTRPTPGMREAMAQAAVGDDVYADDPTVRRLEARTAEVLGKEDAVYMPTGTMTNQVAIRAHTEHGDRVIMDIGSHVVRSEGGAPAALSGVTVQPLLGDRGIFTATQLRDALGVAHPGSPTTLTPPATLLTVENTHNGGGGSIWPLELFDEVVAIARAAGLRCHLDGARVWNASAATGITPARYARDFDSVSVCFSKALGAPVGSALAGPTDFIARARRFKQLFGGGFRQAGIIAAGALYALENHRADLAHDHEKAGCLADVLVSDPGRGAGAGARRDQHPAFRRAGQRRGLCGRMPGAGRRHAGFGCAQRPCGLPPGRLAGRCQAGGRGCAGSSDSHSSISAIRSSASGKPVR